MINEMLTKTCSALFGPQLDCRWDQPSRLSVWTTRLTPCRACGGWWTATPALALAPGTCTMSSTGTAGWHGVAGMDAGLWGPGRARWPCTGTRSRTTPSSGCLRNRAFVGRATGAGRGRRAAGRHGRLRPAVHWAFGVLQLLSGDTWARPRGSCRPVGASAVRGRRRGRAPLRF